MAHGWPSSGPAVSGAIVYRGLVLDAQELAWVQKLIDEQQRLTRLEIARRVCRRYGWKRAGGTYAADSVRLLLARCERRGLLRLPEPRGARSSGAARQGARRVLLDVPLAPPPGWEPLVSASGPLLVRPITTQERDGWRLHVQRYHYLGDCPHVGESLRYAAFVGEELVALLSWAAASLHNAPRDAYLGWDAPRKMRRLGFVVNNVRFLVLPWIRVPHLASRILGANLRRLSTDWDARYGHPVLLAETFVDSSRFRGTCYRASNWIHLGATQGFSRHGASYRLNGQPKAVFVYPLHRKARQWLGGAAENPWEQSSRKGKHMIDVEALPVRGHGSLMEVFQGMVDFRKARGKRHPLSYVLGVAACAVLSGARSLVAIAEWAHEQKPETLKRLGSRYGRPPGETTFRRILSRIDTEEVDRRLGKWTARHVEPAGAGISLDGKSLRGSGHGGAAAVHLVSAVVHGEGLVLAQSPVPDKSNEIKSVEAVLGPLDIRGAVVTGDAMFTQKQIASYIVEKKQADYLLTVKENQPTLLADIRDLRMEAFPPGARDDRQGPRTGGGAPDLDE